MPETFLTFDFGANEEAAQQARHKLEGWKQAFRLDKKLLFKFDRGEAAAEPATEDAKVKTMAKGKAATKSKSEDGAAEANGKVQLLVRLYFSEYEKLTEQRWIERIPVEEPFKGAAPRVVRRSDAGFGEIAKQFESLDSFSGGRIDFSAG